MNGNIESVSIPAGSVEWCQILNDWTQTDFEGMDLIK